MNKNLKYALVGTAAAVTVYVVYKKMSANAGPAKPTVSGGLGGIVDGIRDVIGAVQGKPAPTGPGGIVSPDNTPLSTTAVHSADGDSAISNSNGTDKASMLYAMPAVGDYKSRAIAGDINYSFYGLAPARSRA